MRKILKYSIFFNIVLIFLMGAQTAMSVESIVDNEVSINAEVIKKPPLPPSPEIYIPKDEGSQRLIYSDLTKKIESAEQAIAQLEYVSSMVVERQAQLERSVYDPSQKIQELMAALKVGGRWKIKSIVSDLYISFINDGMSRRDFSLRDRDDFLMPNAGRRYLRKLEDDISNISMEYSRKLENSVPDILGGVLSLDEEPKTKEKAIKITESELKQFLELISQANRKIYISEVKKVMDKIAEELSGETSRLKEEVRQLSVAREEASKLLAKGRVQINELSIQIGLPLFCATVIILFIIPFIQKNRDGLGNAGSISGSFNFSILVEISTVLLLTMSILILGLADKLEKSVLGTLLGGISGYVLNKTASRIRGNFDT
nr:hypothetical protein [uncultured Albidiferax sp.]